MPGNCYCVIFNVLLGVNKHAKRFQTIICFSSSEIIVKEPGSGSGLWNWYIATDSQGAGVSGHDIKKMLGVM